MTAKLAERRPPQRPRPSLVSRRRWLVSAALAFALVTVVAARAAPTLRFAAARVVARVPWDGYPGEIGMADLSGDGIPDILAVKFLDGNPSETHSLTLLAGDGKGGFRDMTTQIFIGAVPRTQHARKIVFADFNGDGRTDFFIADTGNDNPPFAGFPNTLVLSAPGGKLVDASANLPPEVAYTHVAAAADVNGDGAPDLYVGNICCGPPPEILPNDGSGHFSVLPNALPAAMEDYQSSGERYTAAAFADVNGDGAPDLVLGGENTTPDAVLLNDGHGHFTPLPGAMPAKPFAPDAEALAAAPVDLNGDGHIDLLLAFTKGTPFYVGRWIQVLIGNGDGTFRDETATRLPQSDNAFPWPYALRVGDLNGDGKPDLAVATAEGAPALYLNRGNGTFTPLQVPYPPYPMLDLADTNRDGRLDLVSVTPGFQGGTDTYAVNLQNAPTTSKPPPKKCHRRPHHRCHR